MSDREKLGKVAGIVAFVLCLAGGLCIIPWKDFFKGEPDASPDMFAVGLGLYFIGKAFFVGPMLYLTGQMAARGLR